MRIEVFHSEPPCRKCEKCSEVVRKVSSEFDNIDIEEYGSNSERFEELGLLMTPTVVIDGKILKQGGVPREEEIIKAIEKLSRD